MLQPRRTKYRKQMKGKNRGLASRGSTINLANMALKQLGEEELRLDR